MFVIIVWLFLACVFTVFWLGAFLLFTFGRRRNSRVATWLGGTLLLCITLPAIALVGLVGNGLIRRTNPKLLYADTFHERPSADVANIRSQSSLFGDSTYTFMRFEASPETFHRIIPEHMKKVSYADYQKEIRAGTSDSPLWWSLPTEKTSEIYLSVPDWGSGNHFASETELLTYDRGSKTAMYFFLGSE